MKAKGKEYADRKRRAIESTIGVDEKVYIKKKIKENKLSSTFIDTPLSNQQKRGKWTNPAKKCSSLKKGRRVESLF